MGTILCMLALLIIACIKLIVYQRIRAMANGPDDTFDPAEYQRELQATFRRQPRIKRREQQFLQAYILAILRIAAHWSHKIKAQSQVHIQSIRQLVAGAEFGRGILHS